MVGLSRSSLDGRGRTGAATSFLKTLKQEETDARSYHTMEELEQHVAELIGQIDNRVRCTRPWVTCRLRNSKRTGAVRNRASVVAGGTKLAPS